MRRKALFFGLLPSDEAPSFYLNATPDTLDFGAEADTQQFTISSNVNWTITKDRSWITVSPTSGSNNDTIDVTVTNNIGSGATFRSGSIYIAGDNGVDTRIVSIFQEALL